jgi:hypothetical protein
MIIGGALLAINHSPPSIGRIGWLEAPPPISRARDHRKPHKNQNLSFRPSESSPPKPPCFFCPSQLRDEGATR